MDLFWRLILAHLLADFTLQTDYIASWKRKNMAGGLAHSLVFFVCGAALCFGQLGDPWVVFGHSLPVSIWVALAALTFFHFLEDEWRVQTIKRASSKDSLLFFFVDQGVHVALIFLFFPPLAAQSPEKWVALAILLVLTTHFTSIFIYFIEKQLRGSSELVASERYNSMAERLVTGLLLLLPGAWALISAAWLGLVFFRWFKNKQAVPALNMAIGNSLAVLFGIMARAVFYS